MTRGPKAAAVWHRVVSYTSTANLHRTAAIEWRRVASEARRKGDVESATYHDALAATQDDLARVNDTAAGMLAAATLRLDDCEATPT